MSAIGADGIVGFAACTRVGAITLRDQLVDETVGGIVEDVKRALHFLSLHRWHALMTLLRTSRPSPSESSEALCTFDRGIVKGADRLALTNRVSGENDKASYST